MPVSSSARPPLTAELTEQEFLRWYWLKEELQAFARDRDVRATGSKALLTARIAASLAGRSFVEPTPARRASGPQLAGVLTAETVIPVGQRCSQVIRGWMVSQIGPSFHFDAEMRAFFAASDGTTTMQDALDHWHRTRGQGVTSIDEQFEYNRFTRSWHAAHPEASREELLDAWRAYRNTPVDERGRV